MKIQQLILFRSFQYGALFDDLSALLGKSEKQSERDIYTVAGELIEFAGRYGFEGDLIHCFYAFCLANHENAYSRSCEIVGSVEGSVNTFMLHDCRVFHELFTASPEADSAEAEAVWAAVRSFVPANRESKVFNRRVRDRILTLAATLGGVGDAEAFKDAVTQFYHEFGVGKFGLNKAFDVEERADGRAYIEPITRIEHIYLNDLIGYEWQKEQLIRNTEAFLRGVPANNVLLFGDAGTGKSSSVKAIVNEYYERGLRIIEVYKHQFKLLSDILEQVKDRNYKFIIYMDDLSFEDSELEYKYLKAILEGGIGRKPDNVLIYATSNRRHLIRESFRDKEEVDEELHTRDTVQEKLSLSARFGLSIYFGQPTPAEFKKIVLALAKRNGITMPDGEVLAEANRWELRHGGLSGRTAAQFIVYLQGQES